MTTDQTAAALRAMSDVIEHYDPVFAAGFCREMGRQVEEEQNTGAGDAGRVLHGACQLRRETSLAPTF